MKNAGSMQAGTALITGGTGLLGQGLLATIPDDWSVVSAQRRPFRSEIAGVEPVTLDVRSRSAVDALFASRRIDAVIHTAGIASVDYAEQHVEEAIESNVTGTRNIAESCRASGARLVYVSTNAVFDGTRAPYGESDLVNPLNAYGRMKVACEQLVRETIDDCVIVRPIFMYGWPHPMGRPNMVTWVIDRLTRGDTIPVVDDVFENPLYNVHGGRAIWEILARDIHGIVHLAGRNVVSRFELARLVAEVFDLDASCIRAVSSDYFADIAPRPRNTSFVTARMESDLDIEPLSLGDGLRTMAACHPVRG